MDSMGERLAKIRTELMQGLVLFFVSEEDPRHIQELRKFVRKHIQNSKDFRRELLKFYSLRSNFKSSPATWATKYNELLELFEKDLETKSSEEVANKLKIINEELELALISENLSGDEK